MSIRASGFAANLGEIEFIKIKGMWEKAEQKFSNISLHQVYTTAQSQDMRYEHIKLQW